MAVVARATVTMTETVTATVTATMTETVTVTAPPTSPSDPAPSSTTTSSGSPTPTTPTTSTMPTPTTPTTTVTSSGSPTPTTPTLTTPTLTTPTQTTPTQTTPTQTTPTQTPTSPTPTDPTPPTPTITTPTSTPPPSGGRFPTATSAGVPAGWVPDRSVTGNYTVSTAGAVIEDLLITNGSLLVRAPNVTIRRVQVLGGVIDNQTNGCFNGLTIEDTSITRGPSQVTRDTDPSAIMAGGYTARNVSIIGVPEGFRVGGDSAGCGPVVIEDSYVHVIAPDVCNDWHGDGLQGYDGPAVTVRNTVLRLTESRGCGATAPFFYPSGQGNTHADIDGLVVDGGGYPFRLGTTGTVRNLHIIDNSWGYGPISVACRLLSSWQASVSTYDAAGQPVVVRAQSCNTNDGS